MIRRVLLPVLVALAVAGCGGDSDSKQPKVQNANDPKLQKLSSAPAPAMPGAKGGPAASPPQ
ncbi:MAG: hypothetical protein JWO38_2376 [Gemmataceae bacterium]|nr:hypothetical protein [Gemmataceae bacterium]